MARSGVTVAMEVPVGVLLGLRPLLGELGDLKRVRVAGRSGSLAEQAFTRSWSRLVAGEDLETVARSETAAAIAAARLAGLDRPTLERVGLRPAEAVTVLQASYDEVARCLLDGDGLREVLVDPLPPVGQVPDFVSLLVAQPRAGATRPGRARLVLEPPESHGDHCQTVAIYAALLAPACGGDLATSWLVGLGHHLHNAVLPDAGFTGEVLLGKHLPRVLSRLTDEALAQLPTSLAEQVRSVLPLRDDAATPESRAFHAADVLDRVLQTVHHAGMAAFTVDRALDDLELVHAGPVQAFQYDVLAAAGLH